MKCYWNISVSPIFLVSRKTWFLKTISGFLRVCFFFFSRITATSHKLLDPSFLILRPTRILVKVKNYPWTSSFFSSSRFWNPVLNMMSTRHISHFFFSFLRLIYFFFILVVVLHIYFFYFWRLFLDVNRRNVFAHIYTHICILWGTRVAFEVFFYA